MASTLRVRRTMRLTLVAGVLIACTAASTVAPASTTGGEPNPFTLTNGFYRDPHSGAATWVRTHPDDRRAAPIRRRIASVPTARWFAGTPETIRAEVDTHVSAAADRNQLPVLVAYNIPQRDCGNHNAGGVANAEVYGKWIREFARGIGNRPAVVILEPDSLLLLPCLSPQQRAMRLATLNAAVGMLAAHAPRTWTYLDGSDARWTPPAVMAERLRAAGVAQARGFALNVSNYNWYRSVVRYGDELRAVLARSGIDSSFTVDNSRNGQGPPSDGAWCNPPGRALGRQPEEGGPRGVDAGLWIKAPGETDGECGIGTGYGVSGFVPELAMELIKNTR